MSSGLRAFARLITAAAVVTVYVALHMAIFLGMELRDRDDFRAAPEQAAAFVTALDRYADGDASVHAEIRATRAWFEDNAPRLGDSRYAVSAAVRHAEKGEVSAARESASNLTTYVVRDQAALDRDVSSWDTVTLWWTVAAAALVAPALWLRHRRQAGAAEIVEVVGRFAPRQPRWRRPVFVAASGAGYALFTAGFFAVTMAQQRGHKMPLAAQVLLLPGGLAALGAGFLVLRYSRPRSARGAVRALLADGRRPVLYLRSFADDHTAAQVDDGPNLNIHSREEQLAGVLGAFGPVIAVGKPGEPLPRLGAARFYLPLDDWQPVILRLMELSQLIVLSVGLGEGLWWELEQAVSSHPAHKVVLLVPGRTTGAGVAERLDELLPVPSRLGEMSAGDGGPWISAAIAFGPGWTPRVCPVEPAAGAAAPPRGGRVRRAYKASLGPMTVMTPARHVARAVKSALASSGVRRWAVIMRADMGMLVTLGKGFLALGALALPYRALELAGFW
ncbi:transferase [Streptomyces klenkii]